MSPRQVLVFILISLNCLSFQNYYPTPTHFEKSRQQIFDRVVSYNIIVNFDFKEDRMILGALLNSQQNLFQSTLEELSKIEKFSDLFIATSEVLDRNFELYDIVNRLQYDHNHVGNLGYKCTYTARIFNHDQLKNIRIVDSLFNATNMDIQKALQAENKIEYMKNPEYESIFINLLQLTDYLIQFEILINRLVHMINDALALKIMETKYARLLKSEDITCPKITFGINSVLKTEACYSSKDFVRCKTSWFIGETSQMIARFEGLSFAGCKIANHFFKDLNGLPRGLSCKYPNIPQTCYLTKPDLCSQAIMSQDINNIRKYCILEKSTDDIVFGFESIVFLNLSQPDYFNLRSQFPMLPPSVELPIILAGGLLKITLDNFYYEAQYFNNFRYYSPTLTFNSSLLCPLEVNKIEEKKTGEYLIMYLISLANSVMLGTLIICTVCIRKVCSKYLNAQDANASNSRMSAAPPAYQPNRSESALRADEEALGLIRLMARRTN